MKLLKKKEFYIFEFICHKFFTQKKSLRSDKKKYINFFRLIHCMPQSATLGSFRPPIPTISHFDVLGFKPDPFDY